MEALAQEKARLEAERSAAAAAAAQRAALQSASSMQLRSSHRTPSARKGASIDNLVSIIYEKQRVVDLPPSSRSHASASTAAPHSSSTAPPTHGSLHTRFASPVTAAKPEPPPVAYSPMRMMAARLQP